MTRTSKSAITAVLSPRARKYDRGCSWSKHDRRASNEKENGLTRAPAQHRRGYRQSSGPGSGGFDLRVVLTMPQTVWVLSSSRIPRPEATATTPAGSARTPEAVHAHPIDRRNRRRTTGSIAAPALDFARRRTLTVSSRYDRVASSSVFVNGVGVVREDGRTARSPAVEREVNSWIHVETVRAAESCSLDPREIPEPVLSIDRRGAPRVRCRRG